MENTIFVKPKKKEFIVIKPDGKRLRAEGEIVKADVTGAAAKWTAR